MTAGAGQSRPTLIDPFGRAINYLRISVTDRCDFRCIYCMAEQTTFLPRAQLLTLEEIATIAAAFVELGVTKIRVSGGEPLARANVMSLLTTLGGLPGLNELTLTTNGARLARYAQPLRAAGVRRLNISLDSLQPARFQAITRTGELEQVLTGIAAAQAAGFERIKLNTVVLANRNDDELVDLVRFAVARGLDISFIEEMPLGGLADHQPEGSRCSSDQVLAKVSEVFDLLPSTETTGGPSRYYRLAGSASRLGLIAPHSHNFCAQCNRVRLTTEGQLVLCLGQADAVDLKRVLRAHPDNPGALAAAIRGAIARKPYGHHFAREQPLDYRYMHMTGG